MFSGVESEQLLSSDDDELGFGVMTLTFPFFFPRSRSAESFFAGGGGDEGEVGALIFL